MTAVRHPCRRWRLRGRRAATGALFALLLIVVLSGCAAPLTVRAPILEMPPIPARLLEPCEAPAPLQTGSFQELYLAMLQDAGPWGRCVRNHDALIEIVKYRDAVMAAYRAQAAQPKGWRWPWE